MRGFWLLHKILVLTTEQGDGGLSFVCCLSKAAVVICLHWSFSIKKNGDVICFAHILPFLIMQGIKWQEQMQPFSHRSAHSWLLQLTWKLYSAPAVFFNKSWKCPVLWTFHSHKPHTVHFGLKISLMLIPPLQITSILKHNMFALLSVKKTTLCKKCQCVLFGVENRKQKPCEVWCCKML